MLRDSLAGVLRVPRRWRSGLRRTTQARAIQGSNTIEGYTVSEQDAVAAVDDEPPLTADQRTWSEILGYRRGRYYVAADMLREVGRDIRSGREPLADPYPWLPGELRARTGR
ncbi:hypothetical protein ACQFYA_01800 [Promicromonospora sp. Marseille-Q5078]